MRATTQIDIAKAAGVSQRAVGAVVGTGATNPNNRTRVSDETRKLILKVAAELNYQPHRQAQLMRGVKSGLIGILKAASSAQYHLEKDFFASKAASEAGYVVMTSDYQAYAALDRSVDMLLDAQVEGVMLIGFSNENITPPLLRFGERNIPVVSLPSGGTSLYPSVVTEHRAGVKAIVHHLAGQGMSRLVFGSPNITGIDSMLTGTHQQRLAGFLEGIAECGIAASCEVIDVDFFHKYAEGDISGSALHGRHGPFEPRGRFDLYVYGEILAQKLLAGKRNALPQALICSNDSWAFGALGVLQGAGLRVPEDIALAGFDGEILGAYMKPALTTVRQPSDAIAERGMQMLLQLIRGEPLGPDERAVRLPGKLIVRESSQLR